MRRKLTNNEIYAIVRSEDECGVNNLILELYDNNDVDVYCEIDENGLFGKYEVVQRKGGK